MTMYTCWIYKLRAGAFSVEDYYLFGVLITKPYFKLCTFCVGVLFGFFYIEILKYRNLENINDKQK
jgi:hypothetical protein